MIEILKLIYHTFIRSMSTFVWFLSREIDNMTVIGLGFLIVHVSYIIVLFTMGFLTLKFIKKKKYWTSTSFFIIFFLMLSYIITFVLNIARK